MHTIEFAPLRRTLIATASTLIAAAVTSAGRASRPVILYGATIARLRDATATFSPASRLGQGAAAAHRRDSLSTVP